MLGREKDCVIFYFETQTFSAFAWEICHFLRVRRQLLALDRSCSNLALPVSISHVSIIAKNVARLLLVGESRSNIFFAISDWLETFFATMYSHGWLRTIGRCSPLGKAHDVMGRLKFLYS